jgi:hypothetical protein
MSFWSKDTLACIQFHAADLLASATRAYINTNKYTDNFSARRAVTCSYFSDDRGKPVVSCPLYHLYDVIGKLIYIV